MFDKVLIANRGEIACRIIATCRRLGIRSVAVYSDADAGALHVRQADEARRLGPASPRESYLNIARVIDAARASGAQAIHPGYGFLSENPQLALAAAEAGLTFVGPPVKAMEAMASKATARELMQRSGVPVLPGYEGERQDAEWLRAQAERIGYPVLIKAAAGGGGKGMRAVARPEDFEASLGACQREALTAFGDARVILERHLPSPRHVEVQVFGDSTGHIVHLYERDCSAQRRHQKVLEEALAPRLTDQQRAGLTQAACEAARAVGYTGAGTVEFLLDQGGAFYFIEMNTRIQVEHAVTEMITGLDLVEWQLRVAAGEPLPCSQSDIHVSGHAIEARLYAESPEHGFLPSSGRLTQFELPEAGPTVRVETGVSAGDQVGIDYDPMLAKLIVHASSRDEAVAALQDALVRVRVAGVSTNLLFLRRLAATDAFRAGAMNTDYIERHLRGLLSADAHPVPSLVLAAAALFTVWQERATRESPAALSPWERADGWRLNAVLERQLLFGPVEDAAGAAQHGRAANPLPVRLQYRPGGAWLELGADQGEAALQGLDADLYQVRFAGQGARVRIQGEGGLLQVELALMQYRLRRHDPLAVAAAAQATETNLAAPMPGRIIAQLVRVGESVEPGTPLLIMEAMKMEHTLCAPARGTVRSYRAAVGTQVHEGAQLVEFEPQS
jgi:3-methylcrotonyl-CoA carboxylase alpha subunit